jgi:hypothetical protein
LPFVEWPKTFSAHQAIFENFPFRFFGESLATDLIFRLLIIAIAAIVLVVGVLFFVRKSHIVNDACDFGYGVMRD